MLLQAGQLYVDAWLDQDTCPDYWEDLPAIAQPYAKQKDWWEAYRQAAMRIVGRLEKGLLPKPNCTGAWACLSWGRRRTAVIVSRRGWVCAATWVQAAPCARCEQLQEIRVLPAAKHPGHSKADARRGACCLLHVAPLPCALL